MQKKKKKRNLYYHKNYANRLHGTEPYFKGYGTKLSRASEEGDRE